MSQTFKGLLLVLLFLCLVAFVLYLLLVPGSSQRAAGQADDTMAVVMCQKFVKDRLKAPASADFPAEGRDVRSMGTNRFSIIAAVDSENSFGATLRTRYACRIQYNPEGGSWTLISLDMME